jgi:hypothetical protein
VEHTTLGEFDLLRNGRSSVSGEVWARDTTRQAIQAKLKIDRSREEIDRLNIEVPRVLTFMNDDESHLAAVSTQIKATQPLLAKEIERRYHRRVEVNHEIRIKLHSLEVMPGYTGKLETGLRVKAPSTAEPQSTPLKELEVVEDPDDDEVDDEDNDYVDSLLTTLANVSHHR